MRIDENEWTPQCEQHFRERLARLTWFMEVRLSLARLVLRFCTWLVPSPLLPALLQDEPEDSPDQVLAGPDAAHGYYVPAGSAISSRCLPPGAVVADPVPAGTDDGHGFLVGPAYSDRPYTLRYVAPSGATSGPVAPEYVEPETGHAEPRPKRFH